MRIDGTIKVHGHDIYGAGVELVQVRKQVGMVFQRPNPLPVSRITSYNVCYTKLLRPRRQPDAGHHDPAGGDRGRITSYNVCYTKLLR